MEVWPSGQWQQTVNLPGIPYGGSNPPASTIVTFVDLGVRGGPDGRYGSPGFRFDISGSNSGVESQPSKLLVAGSNPVSRSIRKAEGYPSSASVAPLEKAAAIVDTSGRF